jgi:CheY-like chemotaxis protein
MAILSNLRLLIKKTSRDQSEYKLLEGAIQGAERGAALTKRMLAFARRQELRPEVVHVMRLIDGMVEMLRRSLGPTVQIRVESQEEIWPIRADPNQLELAILNLALNGRDAMADGGDLTIGVANAEVDARNIQLRAGKYVRLTVKDSGCGMDETTLQRATEPFFTTKSVGKGTGLGLSLVHGLTAQSGGSMRISSQIGLGTTVELWFPSVEIGAEAEAPPTPEARARATPSCCVLVVDDDFLVAEGTGSMLKDLGYGVLLATSGKRAVEILRSDPQVGLVITDHAMPDMNGLEFAKKALSLRPDLPIILATGYASNAPLDDLKLPRLSKPYGLEELANMIADLLMKGSTQDGSAIAGDGSDTAPTPSHV